MAHSRALHRQIDTDLVERIEAYGPQRKVHPVIQHARPPRAGNTYRGARRNAAKKGRALARQGIREGYAEGGR